MTQWEEILRQAEVSKGPILIYGATASGKSDLALRLAEAVGGLIVNADALQVWSNWQLLSARPAPYDLARAPHALYGHLPYDVPYSAGHWLRELRPLLDRAARPIIVGGTGLYFRALTEGLVDLPETPREVRAEANARRADQGHDALLAELDGATRARIDVQNPMRVQRAWEVLQATGQGLAAWQDATPPPLVALADCLPIHVLAPRDWLNPRIEHRFNLMLERGALEEAEANLAHWDPDLLSMKAIGAPQLIAHLRGDMTLAAAREAAVTASRQYAKRQRTWGRARMRSWHVWDPSQQTS